MHSPLLDRRCADGRLLADVVMAPLDNRDISPVVVDIGARNGMFLLPKGYAGRSTLIGFEPNPEEYQKLLRRQTDAQESLVNLGRELPQFRSERYFDAAVWDEEETRKLYITRGAGACTMMGEVRPWMREAYYIYPEGDSRRTKSFYDLHAEVLRTVDIPCKRLDDLLSAEPLVDFLKIDAEGAEMHILRGSERLLSRQSVLFIVSEFQLAPYYENHGLFCDQHRWLADRGFRLIGLDFNHPRYRRGPDDLPDASSRGLLIAGDAYFMLDPDAASLEPIVRHRLGAIALAFGFASLGLGLLREAGLLSASDLDAIDAALRQPPARSRRRRLLDAWVAIPYAFDKIVSPLAGALRAIRRALRRHPRRQA